MINPAVSRADGTDADYFAGKVLYPGVTKAMMYRFGGLQLLDSWKSAQTGLCLGHCLSAGPSQLE